MKRRVKTSRIILLFLLSFLISIHIRALHAGEDSVEFKVNRVVWGDDIDSPIKTYPGDSEVPLTVEVQNLSPDKTIKGVKATLLLDNSPFTDIYGKPNATSTGKPTVGEVLKPTDQIEPKSFFTLTFTLNIDDDAIPGTYKQTMIVKYSVESGNDFVEGKPQKLKVEIIISKIESTVTVNVSPQVIEEGEAISVSGSISPAPENATVILRFMGPEREFNITTKTNLDGSFTESFRPEINGTWNVNASWSGDAKHEGAWSSVSFEVRPRVSLSIATSDNKIVGGFDNEFTITIINDGEVPVSALDVSLTIPDPLIVHGKSSWKINYLDVENSTSIHFKVYAPDSAIDNTYSGSLTINYRDDYGESHTDMFPIGLVVTGRVELILYDKMIKPQVVRNGSRFEITATLLNKGTVSAMYVNVSIQSNPILHLTPESASYIGEIEKNSQSPFTLNAYVREDVGNGTYPISMKITYRDDQHIDHSFNTTFYLAVINVKTKPQISEGSSSLFTPLFEQIIMLLTALLTSSVILILYRRHLSRQEDAQLGEDSK